MKLYKVTIENKWNTATFIFYSEERANQFIKDNLARAIHDELAIKIEVTEDDD